MNNLLIESKRRKIIKKMVLDVLKEHGITEMPVDLLKIIRQHKNWQVYSTTRALAAGIINHKTNAKYEGETVYAEGIYYIVYNDQHPVTKQRWTIAHEIAHIYLKTIDQRGRVEEAEANYFAKQLLEPMAVLVDMNAVTVEQIMRASKLSREAAQNRMNDLKRHQAYKAKYGLTNDDIAFLRQFGRMDAAEEIFPFAWLEILA